MEKIHLYLVSVSDNEQSNCKPLVFTALESDIFNIFDRFKGFTISFRVLEHYDDFLERIN